MTAPKWLIPSKRKGEALVKVGHKWHLALILALREYAARESSRLGRKVSQATIMETLALRDPELKQLYLQHQHRLDQEPSESPDSSAASSDPTGKPSTR